MDGGTATTALSKSCILVIVIASVERFSYKGVASNLVTYLTDVVKMSTSSAAKSVNTWCGVTSMLPLAGAFLADSYWDRYSTILASSLLYVVGLLALTSRALLGSSSSSSKPSSSSASLFWSLYLISLGQGGYNPSLQAFGAEQLENADDDELPSSKDSGNNKSKKTSFFQWWYFGVCSGSLLGVTVMAYIQDTSGWGWGFAIPTIAMGASIVLFSCCSRFYAHKHCKTADKPFEAIVHTIKTALRKMGGSKISLPPKDSDSFELALQGEALQVKIDGTEVTAKDPNNCQCVSYSIRAILRLFPIWTMLLTFAVIFQQPATFFTKQGMTMKRNIGDSFLIPPATLQSAITISIILLMPLYDRLIIPIIRIFTRNDKGCNVLQRIGIGMLLSIIAMIIAALVESKRLQMSRRSSAVVPLSIFWLLPQYILLGVSDVFTVVGMQEFFYNQVPSRMRTIGIGLYLSVFGFGSFLSAFLITMIELITSSRQKQSWFSDDMRESRLDNYYWLLALLGSLSLFLFVFLSKHYSDCKDSVNESSS